MKRIISLLLLACPILASAAPDNDKAAVQAVIAKYYNRPLAAHKCQLTEPPKDGQAPSNNIMYCMKPVADHAVTRNGKAARYVLYTGFAYDMEQKIKQDAHASSGLVELFVLEKTDGKWAIKQHGRDEIGAWGETPENKAWKFVQVGSAKFGAMLPSQVIQAKATRRLRKTSCLPMIATASVKALLSAVTITAHILAIAMN